MSSFELFAKDITETLMECGLLPAQDADRVEEIIIEALDRWEGDL